VTYVDTNEVVVMFSPKIDRRPLQYQPKFFQRKHK